MQISLSQDKFTELAASHNVIPVSREIIVDIDTPVSIYLKAGGPSLPYSFILESVTGGDSRGRYSVIGLKNHMTIKGRDSSFVTERQGKRCELKATDAIYALKEAMSPFNLYLDPELSGFFAGAVGFFAYDIIRYYEKVNRDVSFNEKGRAGSDLPDPLQCDDMIYTLPEELIWFDHARGIVRLNRIVFLEEGDDPEALYEKALTGLDELEERLRNGKAQDEYFKTNIPRTRKDQVEESEKSVLKDWKCNTTDEEFHAMVEKAREYMIAGDIFQVVLSKRFYREYKEDPFQLYRALRSANPSPYMFYLNFPEVTLVGSSPEILVKKTGDEILVRPIAGTVRRGRNLAEDKELGEQLLSDPKEIAEHVMLVDLGRNDAGRISTAGSVEVTEFMIIEKYSHVMHIVSNVTGQLQDEYDSFSALWSTLPAGTVSGAPKVRAMQIIEELEKEVRGVYSGCIGYFGFDGDMDSAIALRTMVVKDDTLYVQAGAGLVYDSDPVKENDECFRKAQGLFKAVDLLENGEIR